MAEERRASNTTSTTSKRLWTPPGADVQARTASSSELPEGGYGRPEPWVTKRQLAEHLHVAIRWIEGQHHHGLPHVRRGGVVRYRISEVEAWLRKPPPSS